jgi:hypothetical protein
MKRGCRHNIDASRLRALCIALLLVCGAGLSATAADRGSTLRSAATAAPAAGATSDSTQPANAYGSRRTRRRLV